MEAIKYTIPVAIFIIDTFTVIVMYVCMYVCPSVRPYLPPLLRTRSWSSSPTPKGLISFGITNKQSNKITRALIDHLTEHKFINLHTSDMMTLMILNIRSTVECATRF